MELNKKLKNLRINQKKTLKELALEFELTENQIQHYESGEEEPNISTIKKYSSSFNVSLDNLLNDEPEYVVALNYWDNKQFVDTLLEKEICGEEEAGSFLVFFEPFGDGIIGWGDISVYLFDGDVDADIKKLVVKDNDYSKYVQRIINYIWNIDINGQYVSGIFGESTKEDRHKWESSLSIDWMDGDWESDDLTENRFQIFR